MQSAGVKTLQRLAESGWPTQTAVSVIHNNGSHCCSSTGVTDMLLVTNRGDNQ
ncbi:MAG TPA: hypothetical protein VLG09_06140 [Candidatus Saccharimonadales bacterium]|nr:hypothetical protein [Candidatus Saccharimonadales bacterium]